MKKKEKKIFPYMSIGLGILFFVLFVTLDQLTKKCAVLFLKGQDPVILIWKITALPLAFCRADGLFLSVLQ